MNRMQFMRELSHLLSDISEAEREEALEYYENYFEDAGAEREAEVIRELGSPGKVAAIIKADLSASSGDYGEYTKRGYKIQEPKKRDRCLENIRQEEGKIVRNAGIRQEER